MNYKYVRADNCRYEYFKVHRGPYFCAYCGKLLLNKNNIQIDHIHSIHAVQESRWLRWKYRWYSGGVNNLSNLTTACVNCNQRKKASSRLWWIIRGELPFIAPLIRYMVIFTLWYAGYHMVINYWPVIKSGLNL